MFSFLFKRKEANCKPISACEIKPIKVIQYKHLKGALPCSCGSTNITVAYGVIDWSLLGDIGIYLEKYHCRDCGYAVDMKGYPAHKYNLITNWDYHRLQDYLPATCICGGKIVNELFPTRHGSYHIDSWCYSCNSGIKYNTDGGTIIDHWQEQVQGNLDVAFTFKDEKVVTKKFYLDTLIELFKSGSSDTITMPINGLLTTIRPASLYSLTELNNTIVIK